MEMPWAAKGCAKPAKIPVHAKSNGPCTLKETQPFSINGRSDVVVVVAALVVGTMDSGQTKESSSLVLVMERKWLDDDDDAADRIHSGMGCDGGNRITAKRVWDKTWSVSFIVVL